MHEALALKSVIQFTYDRGSGSRKMDWDSIQRAASFSSSFRVIKPQKMSREDFPRLSINFRPQNARGIRSRLRTGLVIHSLTVKELGSPKNMMITASCTRFSKRGLEKCANSQLMRQLSLPGTKDSFIARCLRLRTTEIGGNAVSLHSRRFLRRIIIIEQYRHWVGNAK